MNPLDRLALAALTAYQRHLSPRKGFCCAHRVRYGGPSCSEYARQTLMADGLWRTLPPLRQRGRACRVAAHRLLADQEAQERRKRRRDTALECLPDACPTDACPDAFDGSCIPDACTWLRRGSRHESRLGPERCSTLVQKPSGKVWLYEGSTLEPSLMEPLLILLASVAMVWVPTGLVQDDPDDDGPPDAFPWGQYRSLDFYSH